jgi:YidC/Oxa1 family membrane protein insertase
MGFEIPFWNTFVQLIESVLVFLATWTGSSGLAIIILTIVVKLAMVPLTLSSLRSAKRMQELQPMLKDLQKKYGHDRQLLSAETMKLYQEYRVNPFGSCLPILIQMPIFFGLYYAILAIATNPAFANAGFSTSFMWIPNLAQFDPFYILPVVVTVTQFISQRMAMPAKIPGQQLDQQQAMMNQMMQIMPLMVGFFAWQFAAGPVIYWITQNIFSGIQQYFITGFGSLRDLPGMKWLPTPPWATPPSPPSDGDSKVIVTKGKPGGPSRPGGGAATSEATAAPGGLMGRLYQQINKRVEQVEQQRSPGQPKTGADAQSTTTDSGTRPSVISSGSPARRSSRRARSKQ